MAIEYSSTAVGKFYYLFRFIYNLVRKHESILILHIQPKQTNKKNTVIRLMLIYCSITPQS